MVVGAVVVGCFVAVVDVCWLLLLVDVGCVCCWLLLVGCCC